MAPWSWSGRYPFVIRFDAQPVERRPEHGHGRHCVVDPWDIGGFHGGDVNDPAFHELLVRWFQWAVFTPILRMHGFRDPVIDPEHAYRDGIAQCNTGSGNELWSFGEANYVILERFLRLRERLRPYIGEQMKAAHEHGTPLMRPLFYDFPAEPACWAIEDQYMFGPPTFWSPPSSARDSTKEPCGFPPGGRMDRPVSRVAPIRVGPRSLQRPVSTRYRVFVRTGPRCCRSS